MCLFDSLEIYQKMGEQRKERARVAISRAKRIAAETWGFKFFGERMIEIRQTADQPNLGVAKMQCQRDVVMAM